MKIVIPGGSGQIGTVLARHFHHSGHDVVVLSRRADTSQPWRVVEWDARTAGTWCEHIDGADVVINLAGRSVDCRYNAANRRAIIESRTQSTKAVGDAIALAEHPPAVWLQMSTATIYQHSLDVPNDEAHGTLGVRPEEPDTWHFSFDVATQWEAAANAFNLPLTRVVLLRTAMMMSPDRGGVFDVLLGMVRKRLGGRAGNGRQMVSWIHDRDFVRAIEFLIERDMRGPVNLAAPNPLPNAAFMAAIRDAAGIKLGLPAMAWMVEVGAIFLRTESELILKSRNVIPGKLADAGFRFDFPEWDAAAGDLVQRHEAEG